MKINGTSEIIFLISCPHILTLSIGEDSVWCEECNEWVESAEIGRVYAEARDGGVHIEVSGSGYIWEGLLEELKRRRDE